MWPDLLDEPALARSPVQVVAGIAGVGRSLPPGVVSTAEIANGLGVEPDWIVRRTGIRARHRIDETARVAGLAADAARDALADAGVDASDVDLVLVATCTPDEVMPSAAALVAGELGCRGAMAWDVSLACTGWLAAVITAVSLIEAGRARCALVIGAEALSRITDHEDRKTAALFGDGAGAVILREGGRAELRACSLHADSTDAQALRVDNVERKVRMDGQLVFQRAVAGMTECCAEVLETAGVGIEDVALVVPHQANARITAAVAERLGLGAVPIAGTIERHGNTGAASIPLALAELGLPESGHVLTCAFGSGFATAAALFEVVA